MQISRRAFLAAASLGSSTALLAQNAYPNRPIKLIVAAAAGSYSDILLRLVAASMSESLHESIVIDNRPGALGSVGLAVAARSAPDGYTLVGTTNGTLSAAPSLISNLQYDPLKGFTHLGQLMTTAWILGASPSLPVQTTRELMHYGRKNPGALKVGYYSPSVRYATHSFITRAQIDAQQVPYKTMGQIQVDFRSGLLNFMFATQDFALSEAKAGQLRILGTSAPVPSPSAPEIPPISQALPGFELLSWMGLAAPAGLDSRIAGRLTEALHGAMDKPEIRQTFAVMGSDVAFADGAAVENRIRRELVEWNAFARSAKLAPE